MSVKRLSLKSARAAVKEGLHLQFQREELSELHRPVFASAAMLPDKSLDRLGSKKPAPAQLCWSEQVVNHFLEIVRQPVVYRTGKTSFGSLQHVVLQNVLHGPAEGTQSLAGRAPSASYWVECSML